MKMICSVDHSIDFDKLRREYNKAADINLSLFNYYLYLHV